MCAVCVVMHVAQKLSQKLEPLLQFKATSSQEMPVKAQLQDSMIAHCLDVELHSLHGALSHQQLHVCDTWLKDAHESHCAPSCLHRMKTYPRKKCINRHSLRLEQVQWVVAICVEAGMCQKC